MEKKWWYIRGVQTSWLFILLCVAQPALAKPDALVSPKKGKVATVAKTHRSVQPIKKTSTAKKSQTARTQSRQLKAPLSRSTTRPAVALSAKKGKERSRNKPGKRLVARKSQQTAKRASARVTILTKKGKKIVVVKSFRKTSRFAKSRLALRSAASSAKRHGRRRAFASFRGRSARRAAIVASAGSAIRHELIERNYDATAATLPYSPAIAPFPLRVNEEPLAYQINSVFMLPGEKVTLNVGRIQKKNEYSLETALPTTRLGPNTWSWKAPREVGLYPVKILHPNLGATAQLNVFVTVPFSQLEDGYLNGYRIGHYPTTPSRQLSTYTLPRGFIEVTAANENTLVSPHFRLRQFLCKQESDYPKYLALDPRLLAVLETVLQKVNERGHHYPTLSIMSGYRTPYYNRAIGNSTRYSRHLWGDAADIFVDAHPRDGEMDDLNGDGDIDMQDTEVLYDIVYDIYEPRVQRLLAGGFFNEPILQQLVTNGFAEDQRVQKLITGGLARYRETGSHGPFVHVDVRGVFTRWGR